jgi:hypothetical protein
MDQLEIRERRVDLLSRLNLARRDLRQHLGSAIKGSLNGGTGRKVEPRASADASG